LIWMNLWELFGIALLKVSMRVPAIKVDLSTTSAILID
jgi:hypothetical protein